MADVFLHNVFIAAHKHVMQHPYSAKLTYKSKRGHFPAMAGHIYENDVIIGEFKRGATRDHFVPPIEYKFYSERARARFSDFSDSLSIEETIDALIPDKVEE